MRQEKIYENRIICIPCTVFPRAFQEFLMLELSGILLKIMEQHLMHLHTYKKGYHGGGGGGNTHPGNLPKT